MFAPCPYRVWASAATIPGRSGQLTKTVANVGFMESDMVRPSIARGRRRGEASLEHVELDAAIASAAFRGAVGVDRLVGTRSARLDAVGFDAVLDEVRPHRFGAACRQVHVVRAVSPSVGMSRDLDTDRRKAPQDVDRGVEGG